jgi:hypothetical protein
MVGSGTCGASGDGERTIIGSADRVTQKIPKPIPFLKRFRFPMWLVENRIIRRKSPIPLDAGLLKQEGRDARRIASGTRTNFGISRGEVEAGLKRLLLAASVLGNVKRI